MEGALSNSGEKKRDQNLAKELAKYQHSNTQRSLIQLATSILPYFALWAAMVWSLKVSYWLTLALSIVAAGFLVRIFIIFHDCGHGSFFKSKRANTWVGLLTGVITFTPHFYWWHDHAIHHATAGNLDRRGVGDVKVMTVQEYLEAPWFTRLAYRLMRFPPLMFGLGSSLVFLVVHRFTRPGTGKRERASVLWTNLALLAIFILASLTIGWKAYLLVQLPIIFFGTTVGVWLFYVQHNFEGVYWERHERWDYRAAALQGASFYKLPGFLQWFTGNIGFHHIHHLNPRIPNYNLARCQAETPILHTVRPLTLLSSLKCLRHRLWDEEQKRLVSFSAVKRLQKKSSPA